MNKKFFLWIQAILCIALCIVLSLSVIRVLIEHTEQTSDPVYTADIFRSIFRRAVPLFIGAAFMTVLCLVLNIRTDGTSKNDAEFRRDNLKLLADSFSEEALREESLQKKCRWFGLVSAGVCVIPVLIYLVRNLIGKDPFTEESLFRMLLFVLPWVILAFSSLTVTELLREKSILRESRILTEKADCKSCNASNPSAESSSGNRKKIVTGIRVGLICLAVVLIAAGFFNGSITDVFHKAIRICAECIGLG